MNLDNLPDLEEKLERMIQDQNRMAWGKFCIFILALEVFAVFGFWFTEFLKTGILTTFGF